MSTRQGYPVGPLVVPDINPLGAELKEARRVLGKSQDGQQAPGGLAGNGCSATGIKYPNI